MPRKKLKKKKNLLNSHACTRAKQNPVFMGHVYTPEPVHALPAKSVNTSAYASVGPMAVQRQLMPTPSPVGMAPYD